MNRAAYRSITRQGFALGAYRSLLTVAFLVALLHAFPEHQRVSILAVLVFGQGVAGIGLAIKAAATIQDTILDSAERKTRHTILLASDPEWRHASDFWIEVNRRVEAEDVPDHPSPWWMQLGLTAANFAGLLAWDIAAVVFALVIAGLM